MSKSKAIKNQKPHRTPLASAIDREGKMKKNEAKKLREKEKADNRRVRQEAKKKFHAL